MQKTFRLIQIQKTDMFLLVALNIGLNLSEESVKRIEFFVLEDWPVSLGPYIPQIQYLGSSQTFGNMLLGFVSQFFSQAHLCIPRAGCCSQRNRSTSSGFATQGLKTSKSLESDHGGITACEGNKKILSY
jgi:hypothetical protein